MEIGSNEVRKALTKRRVDAEVQRRLAIIEGYGADREDGTVLRFEKALPVSIGWQPGQVVTASSFNEAIQAAMEAEDSGMRTYTYAALRVNGQWYLTGPRQAGHPMAWEDLTIWLAGEGEPVTELVTLVPVVLVAQQAPRPVPTVDVTPDPGWPGTGPRGNSSGNGANDRPRKTGLISTSTLGGVPRHWMLG